MPELPDITLYIDCLRNLTEGKELKAVRLRSPFLLRTFEPTLASCQGRAVVGYRRIGKRIAMELSGQRYLVLHLMIAGRLHWRSAGMALSNKRSLAAFDFEDGTLLLTEASTRQRASLHVVEGDAQLAQHDPGGLEPLQCSAQDFAKRLTAENRTLKRALTLPRLFSGIGNAYSDEILHAARLSPVTLTSRLDHEEICRLHVATQTTLSTWIRRLLAEPVEGMPSKVTAFRAEMAVHGKFGQPCPECDTKVQRIRYAKNEVNYCPRCQTRGRVLADRSLSRLLRSDWPSTIEEWEAESGSDPALPPRRGPPTAE